MKKLGGLLQKIGVSRILALGVLTLLIALRIADPSLVLSVRNQSFDFFQRIKPRDITPQPIAIIDIDDRSLAEIGQWPWPRTKLAELVQKAHGNGAVAIAFDIVFSEYDRLSPSQFAEDLPNLPKGIKSILEKLPSNDEVFADTVSQGRVIVGQTSIRSSSGNREIKQDIKDTQHAFLGPDPKPFLQKFPDMVLNVPELENAASGHGVFTIRPDPDGIYRRIPLVMMVQDRIRLALSTELLRIATGGKAFAIKSNEAGIDGLVVARQLIETESDGTVWPHFSNSDEKRFISAVDILNGKAPAEALRGKLAFVGTSAIGLEDYRPTPMGVSMAGVEIHAQVLENILGKTLLKRPNYSIAVELTVVAVLGLLVIILVPYLGALWTVVTAFLLLLGYAGGSFYLFYNQGQLLDPTFPIISTLLLIMFMATANYIREEQERQQIRGAFGQYVSPDLVDQLSDNPDQLQLGGEKRELTLLFSDVRGFTTISESFKDDPEGLTILMNKFLTVLSEAILHHGGTIDKFMGDAVMAFWNAPLDHPNHIESGCRAAMKMLADVDELNAQRSEEAKKTGKIHYPINVGVGLNSGPCVVGNMGSDNRFDYTALGDTVNLASRLEGQSKPYGVSIVLGSATAQPVEETLAIMELDLIRVKGKTEPERIYGLFGDETMKQDAQFQKAMETNKLMLDTYRDQKWADALKHLDTLSIINEELGLGLSIAYLDIYKTRIDDFKANPPERDWDGVYTATSK